MFRFPNCGARPRGLGKSANPVPKKYERIVRAHHEHTLVLVTRTAIMLNVLVGLGHKPSNQHAPRLTRRPFSSRHDPQCLVITLGPEDNGSTPPAPKTLRISEVFKSIFYLR